MSTTSVCDVPHWYNGNPTRSVIQSTSPEMLGALAENVKKHCVVGGDRAACHGATVAYSAHNQAAASKPYAPSTPSPTVISAKLVHDIGGTSAIDVKTYADLVNVSNAQATAHAATGEFNMWSFGPCNPCYYPTAPINTGTY